MTGVHASEQAQEVWCLADRRFTAAHRALWHLAHLRCDISTDGSGRGGHGQPIRKSAGATKNSASFSSFSEGGSVRVLSTKPDASALQLTTRSQVSFISERYHFVFSLDLSPSVFVVDCSFKGFSTGTYLLDSLLPSLEDTLRLLLTPMMIRGSPFEPELFITVLAQGSPAFNLRLLVQGARVTRKNVSGVLASIRQKLPELVQLQAQWLQATVGGAEAASTAAPRQQFPSAGLMPSSPSKDSIPAMSAAHTAKDGPSKEVAKHNNLDTILRNCLLALSMSSVPDATPALVLLTDGVMTSLFRTLQFDNVLMHLNVLDVALHIVQVGGGFSPWSTLGMCSDLNILHFLASTSPGGVLFQDHHLSLMLRTQGSSHESGSSGASANSQPSTVNRLQLAWLWRASALSMSLDDDQKKAFSDQSFISSLADQTTADSNEQSYVHHLRQLGCKIPPKIQLPGLDIHCSVQPAQVQTPRTPRTSADSGLKHTRSLSRLWSAPLSPTFAPRRLRELSSPAVPSLQLQSLGSSSAGASPLLTIPSMKDFSQAAAMGGTQLDWEEAHSHLYNDHEAVLSGVSLAQIVECRVREGFRLIQHTFVSSSAVSGLGGEVHQAVRFGLTWRPMFKVFYTAEICSNQKVRVRIQTRAPSSEYLKHRGNARYKNNGELGNTQEQLDALVRAVQVVGRRPNSRALLQGHAWRPLVRDRGCRSSAGATSASPLVFGAAL
ncbi:unnamed protein product [Polarella glacialis]|uniref:Uncharacterized protein n=1 Tax=Polarella glacialis TaxID=89957 RepID=A0A813D692_POLGL|nr:unnamed protein product [Polarella glacialis]